MTAALVILIYTIPTANETWTATGKWFEEDYKFILKRNYGNSKLLFFLLDKPTVT